MGPTLTVEGQVSKQRRQQVHDEHGEEGHVGHVLHLSAGAAEKHQIFGLEPGGVWETTKTKEKKKKKNLLFELLIHGQDGGVAHEGEGQDGESVDRLRGNPSVFKDTSRAGSRVLPERFLTCEL